MLDRRVPQLPRAQVPQVGEALCKGWIRISLRPPIEAEAGEDAGRLSIRKLAVEAAAGELPARLVPARAGVRGAWARRDCR